MEKFQDYRSMKCLVPDPRQGPQYNDFVLTNSVVIIYIEKEKTKGHGKFPLGSVP